MPHDFDALAQARTLGALKAAGYTPRSVKDELRENLVAALRTGGDRFPGILGYDDTVLPQLEHAVLGRHDILLLGLRGQAKSRLARLLVRFLDPLLPVVEGSEVNDDPFAPISRFGRTLVAERGDDTPIAWVPRERRFAEKLATPDTTIADLIGDIDPIKAATRKLTYADEDVIHFGIVPRTNRGIFCINELPDLQARIQVGLFNILEEQDVQLRGFNVRFPLDVLLVFTANPEDYTNRGTIVTPLKDRIDAQILTHYPATRDVGVEITRQEAWQERTGTGVRVGIPHYVREVVEQVAFEARASEYVDQKSGVSARLTRAALESLVSAAERRALRCGEVETTIRPADFGALEPALTGKLELVYEGEQTGASAVARLLVGKALKTVFRGYFPDPTERKAGRAAYQTVLDWFAKGGRVALTPDLCLADYAKAVDAVAGLGDVARRHLGAETPEERAAAMEFVLEGLHQHSLLGKELDGPEARYGDLMGAMLAGLTRPAPKRPAEDDDDFGGFDDDEDDAPSRGRRR